MTRSFTAVLAAATILAASCSKDDPKTQHYEVSVTHSQATWKGYLRTGYFNEGTLSIESTGIEVSNGVITKGVFDMPLSSLKNLNLPEEQKPVLIGHLQSADFFHMVLYPSLKFVIGKVTAYKGGDSTAIAGANYRVEGELNMLGVDKPVAFPARIVINDETLEVDADVVIDRTRWGMTYATADTLPDEHFIEPEVSVRLHITGSRMQ